MDLRAVIFDYGCVLCHDQPEPDRRRIEALAGGGGEALWRAYWELRPGYDRGAVSGEDYWDGVAARLGRRLTPERRAELIGADVESWSHLDPRMIAWMEAVAGSGLRVGLLSNAPVEVRDAILGTRAWASRLDAATFSCDVGALKPEPAIYRRCLEALGLEAEPEGALFIDDRAGNVEAAARLGLQAVRYSTCDALAAELAGVAVLPRMPPG